MTRVRCRARVILVAGTLFPWGTFGGPTPVAPSAAAEAPAHEPRCEEFSSVGTAIMDERGVVTLNLVTLPPGPTGHAVMIYKPDDPQYKSILEHLGPIAPNETVNVPPWC